MPVEQVDKVIAGSLRMPLSLVGVDIWGQDVENSELVFDSGDADGICDFTGRDISPTTWLRQPAAFAQVWMRHEDGEAFTGDPRRALAAVLEYYQDNGLTPVVATELEFYLFDSEQEKPQAPVSPVSGKRLDSDQVLSINELEHFDDFFNDVYQACEAHRIAADSTISENGTGQFEINLMHTSDALKAADDTLLFKRLVKGIARRHGLGATFMAKPYGRRSGNGFHVHFSLLDKDGCNVFDDSSDKGSELMLNAVAGLLATMPENMLVFAPHANSYRRLLVNTHAPSNVSWGYDNRTTAIRIPGGSHRARRIEHRVAGADANPYLVLASILGGAALGIKSALQPAAAVTGSAYGGDLPELPVSWRDAIEAFKHGQYISSIYSQQLKKMFVQLKEQELLRFGKQVSEFEYHSYLEVV